MLEVSPDHSFGVLSPAFKGNECESAISGYDLTNHRVSVGYSILSTVTLKQIIFFGNNRIFLT